MTGQDLLDQLRGEEFSGVTFVRDYIQLQFNPPPQLNVYSRCRVVTGERSVELGAAEFASAITGFIGEVVESVVELPEVGIEIHFASGRRIEIPIAPEGPEAVYFQGRNGEWGTWP